MNRDEMLEYCKRSPDLWDTLIIGGGATGLGSAVDSASRGYRTLVLERADFAKGTSSRSTKLIHGGLRYLKQGNISLVSEALKERGLLYKNAPHLVSQLGFFIPHYRWWETYFYGIGIEIYDLLAGKLRLKKSLHVNQEEAHLRFPTLESRNLRGGTIYFDGQFDDARLAISLAQTVVDLGGVAINYMEVLSLLKAKGKVVGVLARDLETNEEYPLHAKSIINATGVFADEIRKMDNQSEIPMIAPSQGVHLVLERSFLPGDTAIIIPKTDDGRVLFFVPWLGNVVVGTTDTPVSKTSYEPKPFDEEIDFLLSHAARYLTRKPKRQDILSIFTGLRPLIQKGKKSTASLSRDHSIFVSDSNLITIAGGKWTTYRKMAEDVIDKAVKVAALPEVPCRTQDLKLHGYTEKTHALDSWLMYGSDAHEMEKLVQFHPDLKRRLHPRLPYLAVEIVWAIRHEMARKLEDVLARRTRALFLDAKAALEIAPNVAQIMAKELGLDENWEKSEIEQFKELARGYLALYTIRGK